MDRSIASVLAGALALVALTWGCGGVGPDLGGTADEVSRQRRIWEAHAPGAYVVEVERLCFCGTAARGPVRVTVDGGVVVAREYSETGTAVPEELQDLFPGVDGLFDILEEAARRPADHVDVTWDPVWGSPATFFIDYSRNVADEELGFRVVSGPT